MEAFYFCLGCTQTVTLRIWSVSTISKMLIIFPRNPNSKDPDALNDFKTLKMTKCNILLLYIFSTLHSTSAWIRVKLSECMTPSQNDHCFLKRNTPKPVSPSHQTHTDTEMSGSLSECVKWPVLSLSFHTQALSVQTPKLTLSSSADLFVYQGQDKKTKMIPSTVHPAADWWWGRLSPGLTKTSHFNSQHTISTSSYCTCCSTIAIIEGRRFNWLFILHNGCCKDESYVLSMGCNVGGLQC